MMSNIDELRAELRRLEQINRELNSELWESRAALIMRHSRWLVSEIMWRQLWMRGEGRLIMRMERL